MFEAHKTSKASENGEVFLNFQEFRRKIRPRGQKIKGNAAILAVVRCRRKIFPFVLSISNPIQMHATGQQAEVAMTDHDHSHGHEDRWKHNGIRIIKGDQLDSNTAQTPGMFRQAAINHARVGAQKIWAGTVAIEPNAKTGVHHHGALESVIFVIRGKARMRWGDRLEYVAEAGPGDFIFVPPYVPHQEINADPDNVLECVLVRSDNEAVVVNITDVDPVEKPEEVYWVDPIHRHPS